MNNKIKQILSFFKGKVQGRGDYFYNIIQHMVDTLFVVDISGRIQTVNQSLLNLLGYKEEELVGKNANILFTEETKFFNKIGWRKLLQEGTLRNLEISYLTKDRQKIPLNFSGSVIHGSHGRVEGVVFVNKDLSRIKASIAELEKTNSNLAKEIQNKDDYQSNLEIRLKAEMQRSEELKEEAGKTAELENAKMELELEIARRSNELTRALTQLKIIQDSVSQKETVSDVEKISAGIAHEIQNPLTYISMAVQYVVDKLNPHDPQKELLNSVDEKINKVKEITQNLIDFSRTYQMNLKPVKIDRILDKICNLIEPRCVHQNINIVKEYNSNVLEIMADPGKIDEVMFNIVDNAIKSMPDRGILKRICLL